MPHLVTHRPRVSNPTVRDDRAGSHRKWETFNAGCYLTGGVAFVLGSICFFPQLSGALAAGSWLFFFGSALYLLVTGHDMVEVIQYWRTHHTRTFANRIERVTAVSYVTGSALFTVGSLGFLPAVGLEVPAVWCFIVGSALFMLGGFINILQVVEAPSLIYMQLFNLTVAQFIVGSSLFLAASIPYLWDIGGGARLAVDTFAAARFTFASVLFLLGAVAIYYRKFVQNKLEAFCRTSKLGALFIHALRSEIEDKAEVGRYTRRRQKPTAARNRGNSRNT